jgi:cobalamin biosynthesis protein CobD/CbiB
MAGALGISLAGPRYYHGVLIEDGEMNAGGRRALGAADIRCALQLYWRADAVIFVTLALVLAGLPYGTGLLLAACAAMVAGALSELALDRRP